MAAVSSQDFFKAVEAGIESRSFPPVLLFHGEEEYLIDQAIKYLRACVVDPASADFNYRVFDTVSGVGPQIREEVETLPMMASHRLVMVRGAHALSEADWQVLEPLVKDPLNSSVLVFVSNKLDKRKKMATTLIDKAMAVEFRRPFDNQIPGWIQHIARGLGLEVQGDAVEALHRRVGESLAEIEAEIRKLSSYLGDRKEIQRDDVLEVVSARREESIFSFATQLGYGDHAAALLQAVRLLDQGESELGLVALTARHFRVLIAIHMGQSQGLAGPKLAAHAQVPPYFLNDYLRQLKGWTFPRLQRVLVVLSETEKALKSSPLSGDIWIDNMVLKIVQLQHREAVAIQGSL